MKKFSWQGILAFAVTAAALCTAGLTARVIGADCDNDGIWTRGMRSGTANAGNQTELQNAVNSNSALINITKNINISSTINFPAGSSIDIQGNGYTLKQTGNGSGSGSVIAYDIVPGTDGGTSSTTTNVVIKKLTITGGHETSTMGGGGIYWQELNSSASTSLTLEDCKIINNKAPYGDGGGIYFDTTDNSSYLKLLNCEVSSNDANGDGGGIYWKNTGSGGAHLTIEDCKIIRNSAYSASSKGGGIAFSASNNATFLNITNSEVAKNLLSGAISIVRGSTNIVNSAIYENIATGVSGIALTGDSSNPAILKLLNSTIYGNTAIGTISGTMKTIKLNGYTSTDINFCTIANNISLPLGTGIEVASTASLDISNSIIAGNNASEIQSVGSTKSKGYNVFGSNIHSSSLTPLSSDISKQSMDAVFGTNTLKVNVKGTPTIALADNSPAVNRVPPDMLLTISTDQRGLPRPGKYKTALLSGDAGAFESGNTPPTPPAPDPEPEPEPEPDPKPEPKQPAKLSTLVLGIALNGTGVIRAEASGDWSVGDSSIIEVSTSPFPHQSADISRSSGGICYVKSLGKPGVTSIKYENETHIGYITVTVSEINITPEAMDKINDMNNGLSNSGVGVVVGGNLSGDIDGIGTIVDKIASIDAAVDSNAPKMLCYEETGKSSAVIELEVPKDGKNYVLPMGYTFAFSEDEIKQLSESVKRTADMDKIFGSDKAAAVEEFFSVFVLQKEIKQGNRKGQLARLMGGAEKQARIISPSDALSAGILRMSNDNRTFSIEFDFYVIDGEDAPKYSEKYKMLVIGDGEKDWLIVDPLWASMRSEATNTNVDGGSGCTIASNTTASSIAGLNIFILLFPLLILGRKRKG